MVFLSCQVESVCDKGSSGMMRLVELTCIVFFRNIASINRKDGNIQRMIVYSDLFSIVKERIRFKM